MLFAGTPRQPFADRVAAAAGAGIDAVEIWGWRDKDLDALERSLRAHGSTLVSMIVDPPIPLVDRSRRAEFLAAVAGSARVAGRLGCGTLVVTAGQARLGVPRLKQWRAIAEALRAASPIASDSGVVLALENLNSRVDHVGTFLDSTAEALDIVDEVGSPAVRLLYDLYHSVVMGESPADVLGSRVDRVRHVQLADVPGRHQPGTGTIDWGVAIGWLTAAGYRGPFGLEYAPLGPPAASLGHIRTVVAAATARAVSP